MRYKILADVYENLSSTTKRLEKTEILSKFLLQISDENKDILYLLLGEIYPDYDERKIGISEQTAIKAISKSTGTPEDKVVEEWKKIGDLGEVAQKLALKKKQQTLHSQTLTVEKVLSNLRKLPELEGKGTIDKKLGLITELLSSASDIESKYLVRTLIGDLRIGLKESTIRESIVKAFFTNDKENHEKVQDAIDKSNDIVKVFFLSKKSHSKISSLDSISLEVGKPIKAMLAQKTKSIKDGFDAVGRPCAIEFKYDGFRLIIHKDKKEIKLFTRRLENVTKQFPEVTEYIEKYIKADSVILDTEAVGFDSKTKQYLPFQKISQRIRRKYDIEKLQSELPVEINVFDVLFYNGKSYLDVPFIKRTGLIKKIVLNHPTKIIHSKQIITDSEKEAQQFYKLALSQNQEGVMMKNLDAVYKPGSRVGFMLKLKPQEKDLDLVITGAEYGNGKRSGWLSSFIVSIYDKENKRFLEIGKVSTGLKEKSESVVEESNLTFEELTELVKPLITKENGKSVVVKPNIVLSVTYQEIQHSPNYDSGYALRFPRFTSLRHDKHPYEATTLEEIKLDMENQKRNWKFG